MLTKPEIQLDESTNMGSFPSDPWVLPTFKCFILSPCCPQLVWSPEKVGSVCSGERAAGHWSWGGGTGMEREACDCRVQEVLALT